MSSCERSHHAASRSRRGSLLLAVAPPSFAQEWSTVPPRVRAAAALGFITLEGAPRRCLTDPDYVVVGAGSSGCALVHRLSARSLRFAILVLEAGVSGEADPAVLTPGRWVVAHGLVVRLELRDRARAGHWTASAHRRSARQGTRRLERHQRDGATSAAVAACFDRWRALGNPGWGYDDLQPLFVRARAHAGGAASVSIRTRVISRFSPRPRSLDFRADARHDFNGPQPEGVAGFYQKNILDGRRHSAAAAFLAPALARPNVEMRSPAQRDAPRCSRDVGSSASSICTTDVSSRCARVARSWCARAPWIHRSC